MWNLVQLIMIKSRVYIPNTWKYWKVSKSRQKKEENLLLKNFSSRRQNYKSMAFFSRSSYHYNSKKKKKKSALIVITTLIDNYCVLGICQALYMIWWWGREEADTLIMPTLQIKRARAWSFNHCPVLFLRTCLTALHKILPKKWVVVGEVTAHWSLVWL